MASKAEEAIADLRKSVALIHRELRTTSVSLDAVHSQVDTVQTALEKEQAYAADRCDDDA